MDIAGLLLKFAGLPRRKLAVVAVGAVSLSVLSLKQQQTSAAASRRRLKKARQKAPPAVGTRGRTKKIQVNKALGSLLLRVLKEGFGGREALNAAALVAALLTRTALSLWIAKNMGDSSTCDRGGARSHQPRACPSFYLLKVERGLDTLSSLR